MVSPAGAQAANRLLLGPECVNESPTLRASGHGGCSYMLPGDLRFLSSHQESQPLLGTPFHLPPQPHPQCLWAPGGTHSPGPQTQIHYIHQTHKHLNSEGRSPTSRPSCSSGSPPSCLRRKENTGTEMI